MGATSMKRAEMTAKQKKKANRQQQGAVARYKSKAYETIQLRIRKDGGNGIYREQIKQSAKREGMSVNDWILYVLKDNL